jgi:hypothetical protein
MHHGIREIPAKLFEIEQEWLVPYHGTPSLQEEDMESRTVRKDNTIMFEGNFYSVPSGTYCGPDSEVFIEKKDGMINIYSKETGKTIAAHPLSLNKGKTVSNHNHRRLYNVDIEEYKTKALAMLPHTENASRWIERVYELKVRYVRDNLKVLEMKSEQYSQETMSLAIDKCMELNVFNANTLMEVAEALRISRNEPMITPAVELKHAVLNLDSQNEKPETSKISTYQSIIEEAI